MSASFYERPRAEGYFPLPNAIFEIGLCAGELAVYSYLMRCENRRTQQCWPSCRTIGKALHMNENTVRKYVCQLGEKELITVEPTAIVTKDGQRRNGSSRYTIRPFRDALMAYHRRTLDQLEAQTARQHAEAALVRRKAHRRRL